MKSKIIFILLSIFWMILIFSMSAENGEESGGLSEKVCRVICQITIKDYNSLPEDIQMEYIEKIHYPVRKLAHMTEFGILAMLYLGCIHAFRGRDKWNVYISVIATFLYACTDELHQLFVSGRGASFIDVLIDTSGAILAMLFCALIIALNKRVNSDIKN